MLAIYFASRREADAPCIALSGDRSLCVAGGVAIGAVALLTRKQVDALRQYPHIGIAFVQLEPAAVESELEAGTDLAAFALSVNRNGALIFSI